MSRTKKPALRWSRRVFMERTVGVTAGMSVASALLPNAAVASMISSQDQAGLEINVWTGWPQHAVSRMEAVLTAHHLPLATTDSVSVVKDQTMRQQLAAVAADCVDAKEYFVTMSRSLSSAIAARSPDNREYELSAWRVNTACAKTSDSGISVHRVLSTTSRDASFLRSAVRCGGDLIACERANPNQHFYRLTV